MVQQRLLTTLFIGAGAGLVSAVPRPQWGFFQHERHHHHHHPKFSFSSWDFPTGTPTGVAPGSLGGVGPTGAHTAAPTATGSVGVAGYSQPAGSGGFSLPGASGTGYSWSGAVAPTGAPSVASSFAPPSAPAGGQSSVEVSAVTPSAPAGSASYAAGNSTVAVAATGTGSSGGSTVTAASGCTFTDASAAQSSKGSCSTIVLSGITVPAGQTLDMTDLSDGTTVSFEGTTSVGYEEWDGPIFSFSGSGITITGASGHVIDGNGAKWWDGEGSNGGKTKPKFFDAHDLTDSTISGLNIKNTPVQCFSIDNAKNLKIEDVTIDDSAGDGDDGGHNTDCFDIGESTGVYITGATCKNQDDCVAINSGSDISFTGGTCSGGHGLSIGSVGGRDDNTVENVYFGSSTVSDSENGCRIKTNSGTTGSVKNATWDSITLSGITDYGIVIEQDYENGDPTGTPTDGVPISDITLSGITGSMSGGQSYYILCASCTDFTVSDVKITGGDSSDSCKGVPSGASSLC